MNLEERKAKIKSLDDSKIISISRFISDKLQDELQDDYHEKILNTDTSQLVHSIYKETGIETDEEKINEYVKQVDKTEVGQSGREFLTLVVEHIKDEDILKSLDALLDKPPEEEAAVIDPASITLIVMGSVALMNVINGIEYEDGHFTFKPARGNQNMKTILDGVANIFKWIIPGR